MNKYFGTDGIRGKVNDKITVELGLSLGASLKAINTTKLLIGYDTRESNKALSSSIIAGALSVGIDVQEIGIITTPGLAYLSMIENAIAIMITASHNPYYDNGFKVFRNGLKLTDQEELMIESCIEKNRHCQYTIGKYEDGKHLTKKYIDFLNTFSQTTDLKIAIDAANGSTTKIVDEVFSTDTQLIIVNNTPNGININLQCGATVPENIFEVCKKENADIGFTFDGDGDRIIAVDKDQIYNGDAIIYIIASYLKNHNQLTNNKVVLTSMSNLGTINSLKKLGIEVLISDVGDKKVWELMNKENAIIGGEHSGHIIIKNIFHTGDGMLCAKYLLDILSKTKSTIKELSKDLVTYPEKHVNIPLKNKDILNNNIVVDTVANLNKQMGDLGRAIIRVSGTENVIRIAVCHKDKTELQKNINFLVFLINLFI